MKGRCKRLLAAFLTCALLVGMLAMGAAGPVSAHTSNDFLKTNGTVIRNRSGAGEIVNLRGTNLGGWMLQEGWMSPLSCTDEWTLRETLTNRFGEATAESLVSTYQNAWLQAGDLDNIKNMGMNVVRVPILYLEIMDKYGNWRQNCWDQLDWLVNECAKRDLYVILDLHGTFGGQNTFDNCGEANSDPQLWKNTTYQDRTVELWRGMAEHYKGNPTVAAYDLLNEPDRVDKTLLNNFYDRLYKTIRAVDPDHILIMEAAWDWGMLDAPSARGWENVVYEKHYYAMSGSEAGDWNVQNTRVDQWVQGVVEHQQRWNVPVYIGEFCLFDFLDIWEKALSAYNANNISWTNWTYKVSSNYGNWGYYNNCSYAAPDIYNDSAEQIAEKWSRFTTNNFRSNTNFQNVVKKYTQTPPAEVTQYTTITAVANEQLVSAANYGNDPLVANQTVAGEWEAFKIITNADGTVSLLSKVSNKFVAMENDTTKELVARSTSVQDWEKFRLAKLGDDTYSLQSVANNMYVTCDLNNGAVLKATASSVGGAWEAFRIGEASPAPTTQPTNPPTQPATQPATQPSEPGEPDLIVSDISWSPAYPQAGEAVTFEATIRNIGTAATPSGVKHGLRFSVGGLNTMPFTWNDQHFDSIPAGGEVTLRAMGGSSGSAFTFPADGDYTVFAWVDDSALIAESNENNNTLTKTITIGRKAPVQPETELYLSGLQILPGTLFAGGTAHAQVAVKNMGANAKLAEIPLKLDLYVDGRLCKTVSYTGEIAAGTSAVILAEDFWQGIYGVHTVRAEVNADGAVPEGENSYANRRITLCRVQEPPEEPAEPSTEPTTQPAEPSTVSSREVYLTAIANENLVCAENYGADPLVSNKQARGTWETFDLITNSDGTVSLRSHINQKYVCTDITTTAASLIAKSDSIGNAEKFTMEALGDGTYGFKALANGKYVTCDMNNGAALVAGRDSVGGAWEAFAVRGVEEPLRKDFSKRVVGYIPDWSFSAYKTVDYTALTHVNIAFGNPDGSGNITTMASDADINALVEKAHLYGVKVLISLGGAGSPSYTPYISTDAAREAFADRIMDFVSRHNLDGVDVDLEGDTVDGYYESFLRSLNTRCRAQGKLLTAAVATWYGSRISTASLQMLDFVNIMAYDYNTSGTGPVAPYDFAVSSIDYFKNKGAAAENIVLGVPFYGYSASSGYTAYKDILAQNPNAYTADFMNGWYYNGDATIRTKTELGKQYGGMMIWELSQDASGDRSLLKIIKDTLW